ncbi:leucine-rich repeat-containing protein 31 isoform X6 [Falco rusticolus]|uniref:leucine-rich repeat-containing protein 31 isoform X6 n=1 Tax=Falco rusticolus TaxID=120794 RepID=UPI0018868257|nr:leucine-rich repeat-containing protein 31 isoform X6 [Falco rusticolus]XP_055579950.1 leucine-rich repeat-containing protein 31 isoform X6 [Falco cherrug]
MLLKLILSMSAYLLKDDVQSCQDKHEEAITESSPFDFVIKRFQGKGSSPGKRKEQPSAIRKFFRGFDFGKSEGKDRREIKEPEINHSEAGDQSEKQDLSVEDGLSHLISAAESPSGEQRFIQFMQKLGKEPNSKNLDVNNCALSAADVTELASLLPFLPDLEEISLSWNGCVGGNLKALTVHLHHVNLLKVLRLNNCRLTAEDVTSLGEAFEIVSQLEELDLSWNSNIGGKLSLLTKKLQKGCKLKLLKITDCNLTAKDGESLAEILSVIPSLEVLDLSINKHIGCSMKVIAQDLKNVPGLKELNLHMCGLKQDGLQGLDTALQHLAELRKLDISCNKEIGGGFKDSTAHLASLKNLEVLDLHQCCVTEEDMTVLSEAALHLPELEILDLSWNKCVGGNLKLLLGALKLATEIQVLRLSSCNLVAEDLALLTLLTQDGHLARLRKLDLSYNNNISDEGWVVFCQGLAVFKELSELDVSLRPSSRRGCGTWFSELLAALTKLPALAELGLQRWVLSESQRKRLESFNQDNKRNIRFDC